MRAKKPGKQNIRYIPLDDIKKIDDDYLTEMENVKKRLGYIKDPDVIKRFQEVLLNSYSGAIDLKALERAVDYAIKLAEIKARENAQKPWRRCWLWKLLFRPVTNRAQDIIEERAELDAERVHRAAEKAINEDWESLPADSGKKLSARQQKRAMKRQLKAVIKRADNADVKEVFDEPQPVLERACTTAEPGKADKAPTSERACTTPKPQATEQLPGQMTFDEVQPQTPTWTRPPRPPRSCRKQ